MIKKYIGMNNLKTIILLVLILAVTAFIWGNSLATEAKSDEISTGIMEIVKEIIDPQDKIEPELFNHILRKTAHFTEFFILGILYMLMKKHIDKKVISSFIFFPLFSTLVTAVIDEYIQLFVDRGSAVKDVVLDFSGALTGILLTIVILLVCKRLKRSIK